MPSNAYQAEKVFGGKKECKENGGSILYAERVGSRVERTKSLTVDVKELQQKLVPSKYDIAILSTKPAARFHLM